MLYLIKKDILVQKSTFALSAALIVFFTFTFSNLGQAGLGIAIMAISYMLTLGASALDDKNNGDKILISLPIRKETIVLSKYLSIFVFLIYAIMGFYILNLLIKILPVPYEVPLTMLSVVIAFVSGMFYFSIALPMVFKYGYLKSKMPTLILLFIIVFAGTPFLKELSENQQSAWSQGIIEFLSGLTPVQSYLLIFVPLLILLAVSYFISVNIYKRREF